MTDAVADRIIEQCEAFIENPENNFLIEYFDEKIDNFNGLSKKSLKNLNIQIVRGFLNILFPPMSY